MLTVWWSTGPKPGNLGDVLTPVILAGLGHPARWAPHRLARLLAIGSIIKFARPGQYVWGSGAMRYGDVPSPKARYLAVRGPLTADVVRRAGGRCPDVYGDPALLLPRVHSPPVEQAHDLGIVPHYRDLPHHKTGHVINLLSANPLRVVDRIRACRAIVSSSLHGIIVAHAYGIPAAWLASDRLNGDGTKFLDYAASVGIELVPYVNVAKAEPVAPGRIDLDALAGALGAL